MVVPERLGPRSKRGWRPACRSCRPAAIARRRRRCGARRESLTPTHPA